MHAAAVFALIMIKRRFYKQEHVDHDGASDDSDSSSSDSDSPPHKEDSDDDGVEEGEEDSKDRLLLMNSHPDYQTLAAAAAAAAAAPADPAALSTALRIAKRDAAFRHLLTDSGAVSHLLCLVADRHRPDLQDLALRLLLHLSLDGDVARVGLVADCAVDRISGALRAPSPAAALAATLLTSLAVLDASKCTIGAHPAAIPGLAALLWEGSARDHREAATALYELCKFPDNRRRTVWCDSIPSLVQLGGTGSERAVEVLGLLAKCREGREQMRRVKNFMGVLGGVLRVGSARGVEHALAVLCFVCADSGEVVSEARREGMLEMCLGFVDDGNEKIVRNALGLARVLEKWELGSFM